MVFKPRAPLSTDQALARIAGQLPGGWPEMASVTDRSESLVRKWGDPEARERIPLDDAIELDIAFQKAGGVGAPLADSYFHRLELAAASAFAEQHNLLTQTEALSTEMGEALAACIRACQPGAGERERADALRELVDVLECAKPMVTALDPSTSKAQGP